MNKSGTETINKNRIYQITYAVMIVFIFVMIVWEAVTNRGKSPAEQLSEGNVAFDEGWYWVDGSAADVSQLNKIPSVVPYHEQSVYH